MVINILCIDRRIYITDELRDNAKGDVGRTWQLFLCSENGAWNTPRKYASTGTGDDRGAASNEHEAVVQSMLSSLGNLPEQYTGHELERAVQNIMSQRGDRQPAGSHPGVDGRGRVRIFAIVCVVFCADIFSCFQMFVFRLFSVFLRLFVCSFLVGTQIVSSLSSRIYILILSHKSWNLS